MGQKITKSATPELDMVARKPECVMEYQGRHGKLTIRLTRNSCPTSAAYEQADKKGDKYAMETCVCIFQGPA